MTASESRTDELIEQIANEGDRVHVLVALEGSRVFSDVMSPETIVSHECDPNATLAEKASAFVESVDDWHEDTNAYDETWQKHAEKQHGDRADELMEADR